MLNFNYLAGRFILFSLYLSSFILLIDSCSSKSSQTEESSTEKTQTDSFQVPVRTNTETLPDSLKLRPILLSEQDKVIRTMVPQTNSNAYVKLNTDGIIQQAILKKPVLIPLNTIKNKEGNSLLDLSGEPIIIGNGGMASFKQYTSDNGLSMDVVVSSFTDASGNLWFGTMGGGISKFDGNSFTNYNTTHGLSHNQIYSIAQDSTGAIWIATLGGGISCFNGKAFKNYNVTSGLADDFVNCITIDKKGIIWCGTREGKVSSFDGKKFTNYTLTDGANNNAVNCVYCDKKGILWFGTERSGLIKYDGNEFKTYSTEQGLNGSTIRCITGDHVGNIWLGKYDYGVSKFDGKTFTQFSSFEGNTQDDIFSIYVDHLNRVWIGTDGGGVMCYDQRVGKGKSFKSYNSEIGLANNSVFGITEDLNGHIWISTYGGGVIRFDGDAFTIFSKIQGLAANNIISIHQDVHGNLWFGSIGSGVSCFNGKSFLNYSQSQGLSGGVVTCMVNDSLGNIWFGTDSGGFSYFDGSSFTTYTTAQGIPANYILCSYIDHTGVAWFGTVGGGLCRFDGKTITNYTTRQGLAGDMVMTISEDKSGKIWAACYGQGISSFDGKTFTNYTTAQGLAFNTVFRIVEDVNGNIWCGTDGKGLSILLKDKINSEKPENRFINYSVRDGLSDNTITQILFLKNKKVALGTNAGVSIFDFPDFKNQTKLKDVEIFNVANGYPIKDVNVGQNCMLEDNQGILWLGTGSDKIPLIRFDYQEVIRNKRKPEINIQSLKINEQSIGWNDLLMNKNNSIDSNLLAARSIEEIHTFKRELSQIDRDTLKAKFGDIQFSGIQNHYPIPEKLVLPYHLNTITFDYSAIEPSNPDLMVYQYKLEGYDAEWNPITTKTNVSFGHIGEGSYTFKLKARYTGISDSLGAAWTEPIEYSFEILPPWYRSWWAYILYIVGTGALLYFIFRWRTSALRRDKIKLEQTVKERTVELEIKNRTVEEKNREILDSIEYAKRIQATILPSVRVVKKYLQDSFILYIPKDIVAGDFYWMESPEDCNTVFFAACDCTGHGVPGAMVSVICHNALNKSLKEFGMRTPSGILDKVGELVIEDFNKNIDIEGEILDGMDASVCALDTDTGKLQWAGANNPLWLVRNGNPLEEIKPDKQPVGQSEDRKPYTNHQFDLQKGDVIYLITDGFADQFGGNKNKKFQKSQLRDLIYQLHTLPMEEQRNKLFDAFIQWKGNTEQIDDITIIGVRL